MTHADRPAPRRARTRSRTTEPVEPLPADGSLAVESLIPSTRDPDRLTVRVAGRIVTRTTRARAAELALAVGTPWTDELARTLESEAAAAAATDHAIRLLAISQKTKSALRDALKRKGHDDAAVKAALTALAARGLLDDRTVAESIARAAIARRPLGRTALVARLRQRGVPQTVAEDVAARFLASRDPLEDARLEAKRALRTISNKLDGAVRSRRLAARLARRGFDPSTIQRVLAELLPHPAMRQSSPPRREPSTDLRRTLRSAPPRPAGPGARSPNNRSDRGPR